VEEDHREFPFFSTPMTEQVAEIDKPPVPNSSSWVVRSSLPALIISAAAAIWCRATVGPTLGLFLGSLLLTTLITPPLILAADARRSWIAAAAIVVGMGAVWAIAILPADISTLEWLACCLVLASYILALAGIANLFVAARLSRSLAAGLTILLGLLWLTWPVWLSPWLTQPMSDWLVPANPIFATNAVLKHLGTWDRAPLAYRALTVLNQDIPYRLPGSIAGACVAHAMTGIITIVFGRWLGTARTPRGPETSFRPA